MHDLFKALSLFAPMAYLSEVYHFEWAQPSVKTTAIIIVLLVFVNSFVYHSMCYLGQFRDIINNNGRRMDLTGQFIAYATGAYILSGSMLYFALVAAYCAWSILMVWRPKDPPLSRQINVIITALLSIIPMGWRGDYENFAGALVTLAVMAHLSKINEYCHALAHLLLVPYLYFMFKSAAKVEDPLPSTELKMGAPFAKRILYI